MLSSTSFFSMAGGASNNIVIAARLLVVYLLLQYITETRGQDECPCVHCGPPMCQPLCKLNCAKCCTCCVYFGARIGKRADHFTSWEAQGLLDIKKRDPFKKVSLRLSILHKSEERLFDTKTGLVVDNPATNDDAVGDPRERKWPFQSEARGGGGEGGVEAGERLPGRGGVLKGEPRNSFEHRWSFKERRREEEEGEEGEGTNRRAMVSITKNRMPKKDDSDSARVK